MMSGITGECVGANACTRVRVSRLMTGGCRVKPLPGNAAPLGELDLWIGAMGPFAIVTRRARGGVFDASFKHPLEPAIIAHFSA